MTTATNNAAKTNEVTKLERDWSYLAKGSVSVEKIGTTFYAYGTELECLRIGYKFRNTPNANVNYSENMGTWYFSLLT